MATYTTRMNSNYSNKSWYLIKWSFPVNEDVSNGSVLIYCPKSEINSRKSNSWTMHCQLETTYDPTTIKCSAFWITNFYSGHVSTSITVLIFRLHYGLARVRRSWSLQQSWKDICVVSIVTFEHNTKASNLCLLLLLPRGRMVNRRPGYAFFCINIFAHRSSGTYGVQSKGHFLIQFLLINGTCWLRLQVKQMNI